MRNFRNKKFLKPKEFGNLGTTLYATYFSDLKLSGHLATMLVWCKIISQQNPNISNLHLFCSILF